jgi:hypothetical protein
MMMSVGSKSILVGRVGRLDPQLRGTQYRPSRWSPRMTTLFSEIGPQAVLVEQRAHPRIKGYDSSTWIEVKNEDTSGLIGG